MTHRNLAILRKFVEKYRGRARDRDFDKVMTTNMLLTLINIVDASDHLFQSLQAKADITTERAVRDLRDELDKIRNVTLS